MIVLSTWMDDFFADFVELKEDLCKEFQVFCDFVKYPLWEKFIKNVNANAAFADEFQVKSPEPHLPTCDDGGKYPIWFYISIYKKFFRRMLDLPIFLLVGRFIMHGI